MNRYGPIHAEIVQKGLPKSNLVIIAYFYKPLHVTLRTLRSGSELAME